MIIYDYDIPEYDIWHMMIDASKQRKGYGSAALKKVLEYIRTKPFGDSNRVTLTCNKENQCVLSIENPQNRKENSPFSDREIPIIRKKHVESFRFFPYLVGKKAAFTAFCPIW